MRKVRVSLCVCAYLCVERGNGWLVWRHFGQNLLSWRWGRSRTHGESIPISFGCTNIRGHMHRCLVRVRFLSVAFTRYQGQVKLRKLLLFVITNVRILTTRSTQTYVELPLPLPTSSIRALITVSPWRAHNLVSASVLSPYVLCLCQFKYLSSVS